jgi:hypothetical protein
VVERAPCIGGPRAALCGRRPRGWGGIRIPFVLFGTRLVIEVGGWSPGCVYVRPRPSASAACRPLLPVASLRIKGAGAGVWVAKGERPAAAGGACGPTLRAVRTCAEAARWNGLPALGARAQRFAASHRLRGRGRGSVRMPLVRWALGGFYLSAIGGPKARWSCVYEGLVHSNSKQLNPPRLLKPRPTADAPSASCFQWLH